MQELKLYTGRSASRLLIGESLENAGKYISGSGTVIITDEIVFRLHGDKFPPGKVIQLQAGEGSKTLVKVSDIYSQLISEEVDRSSFLLGIGGGVVCDIAGFVASTYLRGISFGFVASTLLAQVDASIGGKNGVNHDGYKNMAGVVRQPDFVICDPLLLHTLDPVEYSQGFAEVVKYGAIVDEPFFSFLESSYDKALTGDPEIMERIIYSCAGSKCRIVEQDEQESGERKILNFGHTFAHAFEKLAGVPHGHAVSSGMVLAAGISARLGLIAETDVKRLVDLLKDFRLPVDLLAESGELFEVMKRDKKRDGDNIGMILLDRIGNAIRRDVSLNELKEWTDDLP